MRSTPRPAAMTSSSRRLPPGWITAMAPASAALQWGIALSLELAVVIAFALFCVVAFGQLMPSAGMVQLTHIMYGMHAFSALMGALGPVFIVTAFLTGWPSLIVSVWLLGGLVIFCLGIIGIYLSKIFTETKERPYTVIRQLYGWEDQSPR